MLRVLNINSKIPFGQYKDLPVLMVYVGDPYYIEWLISNTDCAIDNIEYFENIKVIHFFLSIDNSVTGSASGMKKELLVERLGSLTIEQMKYAGFVNFKFSNNAKYENRQKVITTNPEKFYYDETQPHYLVTEFTNFKQNKITLNFIDAKVNALGNQFLYFYFDNTSGIIYDLPLIKKCTIATQFFCDFKISIDSFNEKLKNDNLVFNAEVKKGRIILIE